MDLFFASTNPGKLRELRRLVAGLVIRVVSPEDLGRSPPEVVEDGATFEENAEKKARASALFAGMHALADDSGLCVDALGGAPGVHSARWSDAAAAELGPIAGRSARDERNNDKLLAALAGVPDAERGAEYRALLSVARPDGNVIATVAGVCRGRIGRARRGSGGFGYDPLFVPESELERVARDPATGPPRTMAELSPDEKDAISHRGEAMRKLLPVLAGIARA